MHVLNLTYAGILAFSLSSVALGQAAVAYPSKPVSFIVSAASGGPTDVEVRLYASKMGQMLGNKFIVEHRPGAGTTIGTAYVAKASPDGHTLLVVTSGFTITPSLYKNLPFDIIRDFAPVAQMSQKPLVVVIRSTFPAKDLKEYLAYAKANPGKINYGTTGQGGTAHLVGAWIHSATNTKVTYVAYKGTPPILADMMAGRMDVTGATIQVALPLIKSGKIRAVAITDTKPSKLLPGVMPVAEQGVPGYKYTTWLGIVAPSATPSAIIGKLNDALSRIARSADVISAIEAQGSEVVGGTSEQFRQLIARETVSWRKLIQDNNIKLEQ